MDDQSKRGKSLSMDGSLWVPSYPVSLPTNCLLVQVWAVGLDETDKQLVVGSDGSVVDEAYSFKRSQEAPDQGQKKCKESQEEEAITSSIF
jgi:hypothetical protein